MLMYAFQDSTVRMWNVEDTDQIPLVMENRRAGGLRVAKVGYVNNEEIFHSDICQSLKLAVTF